MLFGDKTDFCALCVSVFITFGYYRKGGEGPPDVVSIVDLVSLSPFLVQQLLELFVCHNLLVPVQDCNIEICIVVPTIRPG